MFDKQKSPKDFMYYSLRRALGLVQLRKFMTPQQREDFRAVLNGKATVVYNKDLCVCRKEMPPLPGDILKKSPAE